MSGFDKSRLDAAWRQILRHGSAVQDVSEARHLVAHDSGVGHGRTHFTRHEAFWTDLLGAVSVVKDDFERLDVLITAASVGAEVYDAARIAKTLGIENVHFYGHDISRKFTERAVEGVYPLAALERVPEVQSWFNLNQPCAGYASIRPESFSNVSFLEPSDIRDLNGSFDIVVENVMNPCPSDIETLLTLRARHLALATYDVVGVSEAFMPVVENLKGALQSRVDQARLQGGLPAASEEMPALFEPSKNPDILTPGSYRFDLL